MKTIEINLINLLYIYSLFLQHENGFLWINDYMQGNADTNEQAFFSTEKETEKLQTKPRYWLKRKNATI